MVARSCTFIATVAIGLTVSLFETTARAQIVVGRGGGGISIGIPGVGGIRLGAPLRSRGVYVAPYGSAPYGYGYGYGGLDYSSPYYGRVTRYAARPITPFASQSLPTAGELGAMNDSELLNAIVSLQAQLDYELQRYDTAASWQSYLRLPEDALPPATDDGRVMLGAASIAETLNRFELTAANPRFVQISGLGSFAAMHAALEELASRMGVAPSMASSSSTNESDRDGIVPPAKPMPPQPSSIVSSPRDPYEYEPRSIEMRNLHATPAGGELREEATGAEPASDQVDARGASSGNEAEQLPAPPPSLVAPQNESAEEHSILSR
ncbi:MAG TPA: hypothetical protein VF175_10865 [Lacipirellula sp.]